MPVGAYKEPDVVAFGIDRYTDIFRFRPFVILHARIKNIQSANTRMPVRREIDRFKIRVNERRALGIGRVDRSSHVFRLAPATGGFILYGFINIRSAVAAFAVAGKIERYTV